MKPIEFGKHPTVHRGKLKCINPSCDNARMRHHHVCNKCWRQLPSNVRTNIYLAETRIEYQARMTEILKFFNVGVTTDAV